MAGVPTAMAAMVARFFGKRARSTDSNCFPAQECRRDHSSRQPYEIDKRDGVEHQRAALRCVEAGPAQGPERVFATIVAEIGEGLFQRKQLARGLRLVRSGTERSSYLRARPIWIIRRVIDLLTTSLS